MNLLSLRLKLIPNSSGGDEDDPKPDPDGGKASNTKGPLKESFMPQTKHLQNLLY